MSCAAYLREAVLDAARHGRLARPRRADAGRTARVWQPGRYGDGELFNSERFRRDGPPQGGGFASARAYGKLLSCLLAGGDAGAAARCSPRRPSTRCSRRSSGRCPAASTAWASGPTSAGASASTCAAQREPHWAGPSLSPRAASHFGASGTLAWLDPERGLGLVALANRGSYSGWWREPWAALGSAVTAAAAAA